MGCCESTNKNTRPSLANSLAVQAMQAIDRNSCSTINSYFELLSKVKIDENFINAQIIAYKCLKTNMLGYSIIKGKEISFKALLENGASLSLMHENLHQQKISPIDVIFAKNHIELLKLFLPYHLENKKNGLSLANNQDFNRKKMTPLHIAVKFGMPSVIDFMYSMYGKDPNAPEEFNFSQLDSENGENLGLLACRYGNRPLLQQFYNKYNSDLHMKNNHNENAIIICLKGLWKNKSCSYDDCIKYLVDYVKIDITHRYEYMISLSSNPDIRRFLTEKLNEKGIFFEGEIFSEFSETSEYDSHYLEFDSLVSRDSNNMTSRLKDSNF
jgi:hypothetical protein